MQPAPKLGEWVEVLTEILEKETKLPWRERRSTQRLLEELRGRGYDRGHDSVRRFVKAWRKLKRLVVGRRTPVPGSPRKYGAHKRHAAVRQLHVRCLDRQRQVLERDRLAAPVELVGFPEDAKLIGNIGMEPEIGRVR